MQGLGAGCVYGGLVVFGFVVAIATAGFVVFRLLKMFNVVEKADL